MGFYIRIIYNCRESGTYFSYMPWLFEKMLSFRKVHSTPIHVTCKFARHYGKDYESEVHVNLDFRMSAIISEMAVVKIGEENI